MTNPTDVAVPGLNQLYMLVEVHIHAPDNTTTLPATTATLVSEKNALPGAFTVRSGSIYKNCPKLKAPSTVSRRFKGYVDNLSDAWSETGRSPHKRRTGPRLIDVDIIPKVVQRYAEESVAYDEATAAITEEVYNQEIEIAREALGDAADEVKWPTREQFLDQCKLVPPKFRRLPADATVPVKASLPAAYVQAICKQNERAELTMLSNAFDDRKDRILQYLSTYLTQLDNGRLQSRTQTKLVDLINPSLAAMAAKLGRMEQAEQINHVFYAIESVIKVDLDKLRKDDAARQQTHAMLSQLTTQFANA